jgi:hypothetical protein
MTRSASAPCSTSCQKTGASTCSSRSRRRRPARSLRAPASPSTPRKADAPRSEGRSENATGTLATLAPARWPFE